MAGTVNGGRLQRTILRQRTPKTYRQLSKLAYGDHQHLREVARTVKVLEDRGLVTRTYEPPSGTAFVVVVGR